MLTVSSHSKKEEQEKIGNFWNWIKNHKDQIFMYSNFTIVGILVIFLLFLLHIWWQIN